MLTAVRPIPSIVRNGACLPARHRAMGLSGHGLEILRLSGNPGRFGKQDILLSNGYIQENMSRGC